MEIDRKELSAALELVRPGLSSKEILIEQSTSFAFVNGRVVTYNDEISISHPVKNLKINGAIHADELYALISKLKQDTFEMTVNDSEVLITCGRTKAGFTLEQDVKLPIDEIGEIGDFFPLPEKFVEFITMAIGACGNDMSKPKLTCINVDETGKIQASDGYRIIQCVLGETMPVPTFLLPAKNAAKIINLEITQIATGEGWVHFKTPDDTVISCRVWNDTYMAIEKHLNIKGTEVQLPKTLNEVLDKAYVFGKRDHIFDEVITIELSSNRILLKSKSDFGWYEEKSNLKYKGDDLTLYITPRLFKNIINRTQTCIVNERAIKFFEEDWQYVGMLKSKQQ